MDPLSITASVIAITGLCAKVTKGLSDVRTKYRTANITILAIRSESGVISASLSQLQSLFTDNASIVAIRFSTRPELAAACDTALTGCMLLYSCLEDEVKELGVAAKKDGGLDRKGKAKTLWKEDTMNALLAQIRGQEIALALLLQALQMESVSEIRRLLIENCDTLDIVATNTDGLRKSYPDNSIPESIFDSHHTTFSIFGDAASAISETNFSFDDIIINSKAYRRVMALAQAQIAQKPEALSHGVEGDSIDFSTSGSPLIRATDDEILEDLRSLDVDQNNLVFENSPKPPVVSSKSMKTYSRSSLIETPPTNRTKQWKAPVSYHVIDASSTDTCHVERWRVAFKNIRRSEDKWKNLCQLVFWTIFAAEWMFLRDISVAIELFRGDMLTKSIQRIDDVYWPLAFFDGVLSILEELRLAHKRILYRPLLEMWEMHGAYAPFDSIPFVELTDITRELYKSYCRKLPAALNAIDRLINCNPNARKQFNDLRKHPWSRGLEYGTYLRVPLLGINTLIRCLEQAQDLLVDDQKLDDVTLALDAWRTLATECDDLIGDRLQVHDIKLLTRQLAIFQSLEGHRLIMKDYLLCQVNESGGSAKQLERSTWQRCRIFLLDHRILVTKVTDEEQFSWNFDTGKIRPKSLNIVADLPTGSYIRSVVGATGPRIEAESDTHAWSVWPLRLGKCIKIYFTTEEQRAVWYRALRQLQESV